MTGAAVEQPQRVVRCIRRPGSTFTVCRCEPCCAHAARMAKIVRTGRYRRVPAEAAWEVIDLWMGRGWTASAMASASGVTLRTVECALNKLRATGRRAPFSPRNARLIVEARDRRPTSGKVSALGSMRRLQALAVQGFGLETLRREMGIPHATLAVVRAGGVEHMAVARADLIADYYRQQVGRFGGDEQAAQRARNRGWLSAVAWHDPDDPDERPDAETVVATVGWKRVTVDEVEWLLALTPLITAQEIAARFGVGRTAVQHALERAGRRDVLARLARNAELAA